MSHRIDEWCMSHPTATDECLLANPEYNILFTKTIGIWSAVTCDNLQRKKGERRIHAYS